MARISGVDIPREKRLEISLTYIFGIGKPTAQRMCADLDISPNTRVRDLTDEEVNALYDKYMSLQDNEFTKAVMQQLLEDANELEQEANTVRSTPMMVIDSALRRNKYEVAPGSVFPLPASSAVR